jgi:RNA polymerase sigma factor (sigma-70 family)
MTMTNGRPVGAWRDLGLLAEGEATAGLSDEALLERFLDARDELAERAFTALVHRHGPMVRGVCRRVLRDPADASDAFQATFLVLARRAGSVRVGGSLAPWLHGVSVRVARRVRAVTLRRNGRERTNVETPEIPGRDQRDLDDLRAVIDEELRRLPGRYRSPLVLFYLEGLSHEEAAGRLGCPVGTVRSRLARGRDLLRDRLTRRGLAPASPRLMVAAFASQSSLNVEALGSTAQAATRLAAGRALGGMVPPSVVTLVAGVSRMMTLQKLAPVAAVATACLLGALGVAKGQGQGPQDPPARKSGDARNGQKATPPPASPSTTPERAEGPGAEAGMDPGAFLDYPAFAVKTEPATGSIDVDPALAEVRVTFSREMKDGSWSWSSLGKDNSLPITGKIHYDKDRRTCIAPVKLEPGKTYAVFLNSPKFTNFRDLEGRPAIPTLLVFKTKAAK